MIKEMINKLWEISIAFSRNSGAGSIPKVYKGLLLDEDENYIKFKVEHKRKDSEIIIINKNYLIEIKRIYE